MDRWTPFELESIARRVAAEWGIAIGAPFQLSNFSYVAPAGPDAVLKIRPSDDEESVHEADALELWAGNGAVRVVRVDHSRRALLLERAWPGSDLAAVDDAAATRIAVDVASRLWCPRAAPFRWIGHYVGSWLAEAKPGSAAGHRLLARARELFVRLDVKDGTLVHGDFHHHNILDAGNRYVAIDPKPMVGEPEFDVAPFLWNPLGSQMTQERTERRLARVCRGGSRPDTHAGLGTHPRRLPRGQRLGWRTCGPYPRDDPTAMRAPGTHFPWPSNDGTGEPTR